MNILVLGMNYAPEKTAIGPLTAELCEHLVAQGHAVSVVTTFPHYPEWKVAQEYQGAWFRREERNRVLVHRGYVRVPGKPGALERMLYDTSFGASALAWALTVPDVDLILAIAPPIQVGPTAMLLSAVKHVPFVLLLQDLAVDAAVAVGALKHPRLIRLGRALENLVYNRAQSIVVVCQGFAENLAARGVPASKVHVLSNWVDTTFIQPIAAPNPFRRQQQIDADRFLALHSGNMGLKQGLDNVLTAAKQIDDDGMLTLLVGDGADRPRLVEIAERERIDSVRFLPLQPRQALPAMLSAADVLLINQRADVIDTVIPSKLLTYMAAGRPIVAAVHPGSETARYIRRAESGMVVAPEEPAALADALRYVRANRDHAQRFAANGRAFAEEHFARDRVLQQFDTFFRRCAQEHA